MFFHRKCPATEGLQVIGRDDLIICKRISFTTSKLMNIGANKFINDHYLINRSYAPSCDDVEEAFCLICFCIHSVIELHFLWNSMLTIMPLEKTLDYRKQIQLKPDIL